MEIEKLAIRDSGSSNLLIFIHGFGGDAHSTFGMMPAYIAGNDLLRDWAIFSIGFPTSLSPDITGVWSADPDLNTLSALLVEELTSPDLKGKNFAFIAHSMGGVILQRALIDSNLGHRIKHVLLFGVPSGGLKKARFGRWLKRQVRDMSINSEFMKNLKTDRELFFRKPAFGLKVIAGIRDEFVPENSSLGPFDKKFHSHVDGNHIEMVKPRRNDSLCVRRVVNLLIGEVDSAADIGLAIPSAEHPKNVVARALGLELAGQRALAIELLTEHKDRNAFVAGALAGMHKRAWLSDKDSSIELANQALAIYRQAFEEALEKGNHNIAGYTGINTAFMTLAMDNKNLKKAASIARKAAKAKRQASKSDKWSTIVEGEALLYMDKFDQAISHYEKGLPNLDVRERVNSIQQAIWISRLLGNYSLELQLAGLLARVGA